jgi:hypothetical protein
MIYELYRHRIDFAIGRLKINSNDGAMEKPAWNQKSCSRLV